MRADGRAPVAAAAPVVVIGAGPAGLTAAYELVRRQQTVVVLEKSQHVGGLARTEIYKGYRFDIGGHRFYTKVPQVQRLWRDALGEDFIKVPRLSRIYYRGRFYQYPLSLLNTLGNLGVVESTLILLSYLRARVKSRRNEDTLEQWVTNRFGRRLFRTFFKTYTEKVWGIPCSRIGSEWAAQRIKDLSLRSAVTHALFGRGRAKSLIGEFDYPLLGPGMMWERFRQMIETFGGEVRTGCGVSRVICGGKRVLAVEAESKEGTTQIECSSLLSSMPVTELIRRLDPPAPPDVLGAARQLRYRDFILVGLIVKRVDLFPDNWIYIHSPEVKVGRIQNFGNWSRAMLADPHHSSLGMEYFCTEGDDVWRMPDVELISLATRELQTLGLARAAEVEDGVVIRQRKAYPVYDADYRKHLAVIRQYLAAFENLQTLGRNGMHRYNNQDHSMLTGILAVQNLLGEQHDLWDVNTERSYYEDFARREGPSDALNAMGARS